MEHVKLIDTENRLSTPFRGLEFWYMVSFAVNNEHLSEEICQNQLRSLWTAYCLHYGLDVDTCGYDNDLLSLWNKMQEAGREVSAWENFDAFDLFMCDCLC